MTDRPTVSVVMAVRDGEHHLPAALDSLLAQTLRDFEVVAVDDGSTDSSPDILDAYRRGDTRLRVLRQQGDGLVTALNRGCAEADGRYIARMDADDVSLPHRLELQVERLELEPEVGVLGGAVVFIRDDGREFGRFAYPPDDGGIRAVLERSAPFVHPAVMLRAELLRASGGYRAAMRHGEDYDLWLRLAERCRMANLGETVLRYRIHPGQVSTRNLAQQTRSILAARAAARARAEGREDPIRGDAPVTADALAALGVTPAEMVRALTEAQVYWARTMSRAGYDRAAAALWRDAARSARDSAADRTLRGRVLRARADLAVEQGRRVRGKALAALARLAAGRSA